MLIKVYTYVVFSVNYSIALAKRALANTRDPFARGLHAEVNLLSL